jgi:hypothetical protein
LLSVVAVLCVLSIDMTYFLIPFLGAVWLYCGLWWAWTY